MMKNIDEKLKQKLEVLAKEAFGDDFKRITIQATEDHYGDPQISVEYVVAFDHELNDDEMMTLARNNIALSRKFNETLNDHDEERTLFSNMRFADQDQDQAAA